MQLACEWKKTGQSAPMSYQVKEIFYTLQGEGQHAGRPAVFCRFAGCNLWSGREQDRAKAPCQFCDTDFVGTDGTLGGRYASAQDLAQVISNLWPADFAQQRFVVLTGGEPLLQVDSALIDALHAAGFYIAVETNGTQAAPVGASGGIDWICVSPKLSGQEWLQRSGQELKLVWPQESAQAPGHQGFDLAKIEQLDFAHFYLQAMDGPNQAANLQSAIAQCLERPRWKLSVQSHKLLGIR